MVAEDHDYQVYISPRNSQTSHAAEKTTEMQAQLAENAACCHHWEPLTSGTGRLQSLQAANKMKTTTIRRTRHATREATTIPSTPTRCQGQQKGHQREREQGKQEASEQDTHRKPAKGKQTAGVSEVEDSQDFFLRFDFGSSTIYGSLGSFSFSFFSMTKQELFFIPFFFE